MAIKLSQSLKQSQNLMMTPQLKQAIKLLTLSHLEMTDVISSELVENPFLEDTVDSDGDKSETDYKVEKLENQTQEANMENFQEKSVLEKDDFDWNNYIETYNNTTYEPNMAKGDPDEQLNYENMVSKGQNLFDHLEWQLRMEHLSEEETNFALEIIGNINDDGYLAITYDELVESSKLNREACDDVRLLVQKLDPVGCGSDNLVDCLLTQAWILEERSPLLEKIIKDHLKDIQSNDFKKIAKVTGASEDAVKATVEILKCFHPKPGRLISNQEIHYVAPDIYVVESNGEFVVKLNDEGVPRLKISKMYQDLFKNSKEGEKEHEYVKEKLNSAMFLIKSIQNRQRTIVKVAKAIVSQQQDFFKKGPKYLKPMILKNIADEIGMHESTVSRVTTNKYMHTPIGMFELKYFFNAGIGNKNSGTDIAGEVLKFKIKELIEKENPKKPLSDQKIVDLLGADDVQVARRTVAKYRELMGILSSSKRKLK